MKARRSVLPLTLIVAATTALAWQDQPWTRHTIDKSSTGADGTRLLDVNGDGFPDIATGWEEGGKIRVYLNPGPSKAKGEWAAVTVGNTESPEDAVFVDLDGDGAIDVLSACEGKNQTLYVHWAPKDKTQYLTESAWKMEALPQSRGMMRWMFTLPMQIDGKNGIDFFAAGKNKGGKLGWWEAPANARDLAAWKWHPLRDVGWVMSLIAADMDGDGDQDLLFNDRYGDRAGVYWLENGADWKEHLVGGADRETRFITTGDLDSDGKIDIVAAAKGHELLWMRRLSADGNQWRTTPIPTPGSAGEPKSVGIGDINRDGKPDLVFSAEGAVGDLRGTMWLAAPDWRPHDISGAPGLKYDLVVLLDMDGDGDLDILSSEERDQLGVFWYENPGTGASGPPLDLARKMTQRETASEAERANYTYRQTVNLNEYSERNRPGGEYREVREIIFSPSGERTERMTSSSNTLKRLQMTPEDFADIRDIQPMMLTEDRMHLYQFVYKGEETIDGVACWVMQVRPRQILYGMRLFEGSVWVDRRDYSILRSEGRAVPQVRSNKPGKENLFPYFTTVREKVGQFWFPVLTEGADTLDFSTGPVRMKLSIRYRDYKRFGAESTIRPTEPEK